MTESVFLSAISEKISVIETQKWLASRAKKSEQEDVSARVKKK